MAIPSRSSVAIPRVGGEQTEWGMTTMGERIKAARKASGLTQSQVADACDVTKGAVSQWEKDGTVPELKSFLKFCQKTRAAADFILLGRGDQLLGHLLDMYDRLSRDGRDNLLVRANRILTEEQPGPAAHDPFGVKPVKHSWATHASLMPQKPAEPIDLKTRRKKR